MVRRGKDRHREGKVRCSAVGGVPDRRVGASVDVGARERWWLLRWLVEVRAICTIPCHTMLYRARSPDRLRTCEPSRAAGVCDRAVAYCGTFHSRAGKSACIKGDWHSIGIQVDPRERAAASHGEEGALLRLLPSPSPAPPSACSEPASPARTPSRGRFLEVDAAWVVL